MASWIPSSWSSISRRRASSSSVGSRVSVTSRTSRSAWGSISAALERGGDGLGQVGLGQLAPGEVHADGQVIVGGQVPCSSAGPASRPRTAPRPRWGRSGRSVRRRRGRPPAPGGPGWGAANAGAPPRRPSGGSPSPRSAGRRRRARRARARGPEPSRCGRAGGPRRRVAWSKSWTRPCAAAGLGQVHGVVGVTQELLGTGAVVVDEGHADAHADVELLTVDHEGFVDGRHGPLGQGHDGVLAGHALAEDHEFVAAETRQGVGGPHDPARAGRPRR